jgi:PAS domain S-box-containing protein
MAIATHEIDTDGVIRSVNQTECKLLGYPAEDLIGHPVWEFVAEEHRQAAREAIAQKVARQQPLAPVNREYRRSDGTYMWLEIHEKLIENAEGEVTGIRSALLDITDRHRSDTELHRQDNWMRSVLRSIATAIVTTDALGNIDFMNPAAETITGWSCQEALGRPLEQVCRVQHDPGDPVDLLSCLLTEPVISNRARQFLLTDRSGANHGVQWTIAPVSNDDQVITGAVLAIERR